MLAEMATGMPPQKIVKNFVVDINGWGISPSSRRRKDATM
jgi:hypothetical protein